jgi:hypothetical protein
MSAEELGVQDWTGPESSLTVTSKCRCAHAGTFIIVGPGVHHDDSNFIQAYGCPTDGFSGNWDPRM